MSENKKCEVFISGMSGRFPEADNVDELYEKLINKVDLITEDAKRWKLGLFGTPKRMGCIKEIEKFDNQFFGLHPNETHTLTPLTRILFEVVHEAIVDAGYDPDELRGRNIGVLVGNCFNDNHSLQISGVDLGKFNGKIFLQNSRSLLSSYISYAFDFKGPSFLVDTACSSGGVALHQAFHGISGGDYEAAIVCAANLLLSPEVSVGFQNIKMISDDGISKVFDVSADGYARSETIGAVFLQRSDLARRNYASIVHMKANVDGFKVDGLTYPLVQMQKRLMSEVLQECHLEPRDIHYIEAHATGTPAGDRVETSSITDIYCSGREEPLLVGSVKSNLGHTEPSAAICQLIKLILSMERGMVPPNLHFKEPHPEYKALMDGRMKVVTESTPWRGQYTAFNSFGFGGANVHGILRTNLVTSLPERRNDNSTPQLMLYGGRTKESVEYLFNSTVVKESPREFFTLLHKSAFTSPMKKPYRGFKLLGVDNNVQEIQFVDSKEQQLWYVFTGTDIQGLAIDSGFMQIKIFAKSIQKSDKILKPFSLDLMKLATRNFKNDARKEDKTNEPSTVEAIVSNVAIQVALVDVFNKLGLKPDGLIGIRLGEIVCAYADGCLTAEQVLLATYWLAKAIENSDIYSTNEKLYANSFEVASNTKSGLQKDNNACHYEDGWKSALPGIEKLQLILKKVVPDPKRRSSRWISSSYPEGKWRDPEAQFANAWYFIHSMTSPVVLDDALRYIPNGAIVIEFGPHDLIDETRSKTFKPGVSYARLMEKDRFNLLNFLSVIGKLYIFGHNPDIENLYPPVAFPVPRSTPSISPLIRWDHSEVWDVFKWNEDQVIPVVKKEYEPGPIHSPDRYLLGHCIDGRFLFPAAGYLILVHKLILSLKSVDSGKDMTITFSNVKFMRASLISERNKTEFVIHISKNFAFEISESGTTVCTGKASVSTEKELNLTARDLEVDKESMSLNTRDIYKEFRLRGYEYGPSFQGITAAILSGREGILKWNDNWVTFLDSIFQIPLLAVKKRVLLIPLGIEKLTIDLSRHAELADKFLKEYNGLPVKYDEETREYFSAGVYAKNIMVACQKKRADTQFPVLEECKFVPYEMSCSSEDESTLNEYINVCLSVSKRLLQRSGKKKDEIEEDTYPLGADVDLINKYLNSDTNCYILLTCLWNILNASKDDELEQILKDCARIYVESLENDILSQILLSESNLRSASEVMLENVILSRNIKVVEVAEGSGNISSTVNGFIPVPSVLKISYSIVHNSTELIDKDLLPPLAEIVPWENKPSLEFQNVDGFILNYLKDSPTDFKIVLENAVACLKEEGFILLFMKTRLFPAEVILSSLSEISIPNIEEDILEEFFKQVNLNIICKKFDSFTSTLYLLRKSKVASYKDSIVHIVDGEYAQWVDKLKEKIMQSLDSSESERIWLVSEGSRHSGIIGLFNCLRLEPGGSTLRCVFTGKEKSEIPPFSLTHPFYAKQIEKNLVMNAFQDGTWGSYRHFRCEAELATRNSEHAFLDILTIGDLSSLAWIRSSLENVTLTDSDIIVHVYYAPLNFKDVMLASGRIRLVPVSDAVVPEDSILGFEFSGRTTDGRRVMGIMSNKAMATTAIANRSLLWDVPDEWTLEEASTVPVVYATAYYSLITRGRLQKGESVLIHSGSGGVGQAAISIALNLGCDVYTTVGSDEKKEFLIKNFPKLDEEHIYNSRDTAFEQEILHATKGEGVNVVLNSLAGDKLLASLNCLAEEGRFLEIGKYDMAVNNNLDTAIFLKNVSFHGILLDAMFLNSNDECHLDICQIVNKGIADGIVKPLNRTVFSHDQAEEAFRYMAKGQHIGKVLLKIRDEEEEKMATPSPTYVEAIVRTLFDPRKSYIIIGGLGGIGLELCQWLIDRRAKNIILTSRSGVTTGYQKMCLERWEQDSVNVILSNLNAVNEEEARRLLTLAANQGPVGGIFNVALVLRDALMEKQTVQNYIDVCDCKVESTKNLDLLTRELCPHLDYFVCFSSAACGLGNAGQSNYGYANSVMERICEDRVDEGLPGFAIRFGAVGDVGFVAETKGSDIIIFGTVPQRISSCLTVLDKFLQQRHPVVSSFVRYQPDEMNKNLGKGDLLSYMAKIFGIKDVSSINPETTLSELGMDSLMAEELKQILELNFDTVLSVPELQKLTVKDLKTVTCHENAKDIEETDKHKSLDIEMYLGKIHALTGKDVIPSDIIIHMNTVANGLPLFLIHPLEGSVTSLYTVAESMLCPVYGIQSTREAPRDSLESLASWYWSHIKSYDTPTESIYLVGYSFGATVAFEMALQAEQDPENYPHIKHLIFLDGSHNTVPTLFRMFSASFDESMENVADQIVTIRAFSVMFSKEAYLDEKQLFKLKSFPERVLYAAEKTVSICPKFSVDDIQAFFSLFSSKLKMSMGYKPKCKLKQDVYLIKASQTLTVGKFLADVYDLDQVCEGNIISNAVEGSHSTFIQDNAAKEVSNIMKENLDKI